MNSSVFEYENDSKGSSIIPLLFIMNWGLLATLIHLLFRSPSVILLDPSCHEMTQYMEMDSLRAKSLVVQLDREQRSSMFTKCVQCYTTLSPLEDRYLSLYNIRLIMRAFLGMTYFENSEAFMISSYGKALDIIYPFMMKNEWFDLMEVFLESPYSFPTDLPDEFQQRYVQHLLQRYWYRMSDLRSHLYWYFEKGWTNLTSAQYDAIFHLLPSDAIQMIAKVRPELYPKKVMDYMRNTGCRSRDFKLWSAILQAVVNSRNKELQDAMLTFCDLTEEDVNRLIIQATESRQGDLVQSLRDSPWALPVRKTEIEGMDISSSLEPSERTMNKIKKEVRFAEDVKDIERKTKNERKEMKRRLKQRAKEKKARKEQDQVVLGLLNHNPSLSVTSTIEKR